MRSQDSLWGSGSIIMGWCTIGKMYASTLKIAVALGFKMISILLLLLLLLG